MDIRIKHKVNGAVVSGVTESPNPCEGWVFVSKDGSSKVVYYREYWEPVEEWVKVEVRKDQLERMVPLYGFEWRYPQ